jgi:vitamin B12 transporter
MEIWILSQKQNYEVGYEANILENKITLNTSLFIRETKNVIDFGATASNTSGYGYINQNKQSDRGVELEAGFKPNQKLNINSFFAYVNGEVQKGPDTEYAFNLSRRPKRTVGANLGYNFTDKLFLSAIYKWTDTRRDIYYDSNFNANDVVLDSYHKVDTYFQYKAKNNLMLFADVKNVFNAKYNDFAGYNTMGTNFNAGLSITFQ